MLPLLYFPAASFFLLGRFYSSFAAVSSFLLNQLLQNEDIVLIKGARYSSKLYQVADELIEKGKK